MRWIGRHWITCRELLGRSERYYKTDEKWKSVNSKPCEGLSHNDTNEWTNYEFIITADKKAYCNNS